MDRVAVLVDAGYLFAAGSALLSGAEKQRRDKISFDEHAAVETLRATSRNLSELPLLRIYWYDGTLRRNGPTLEHLRLARCNDVKVRLGFLNAQGQQKGVDSLIVTDLVDLARNRAVSDVVLMSGDEDVRIGVQLAQGFGVRVHLLGIRPAAGTQSEDLRLEADTCTEWDADVVSGLMSLRVMTGDVLGQQSSARPRLPEPGERASSAGSSDAEPRDVNDLDHVVRSVVDSLPMAALAEVIAHMLANGDDLPHSIDGKLLARCRSVLGRDLLPAERRLIRGRTRERLRERSARDKT